MLFSGFEIGQKIHAGLLIINNNAIQDSPVKDVFRISIPMAREDSAGRMSWDETAVLVGIAGYKPFYKTMPGKIKINNDGSNAWSNEGSGHHYLLEDRPAEEVQNVINTLIMHQPKK